MSNKRLIRFLWGFFLIIAGLFLAVGIISFVISGQKSSLGGTAGDFIADRGLYLFGWVSLWLPAAFIVAGIAMLMRTGAGRWWRLTAGMVLGFAGLMILLALPHTGAGAGEWDPGTQVSSGAIGWLLSGWLYKRIGWAGLLASGGFLACGSAVLLCDDSLFCAIKKCCSITAAAAAAAGRFCRSSAAAMLRRIKIPVWKREKNPSRKPLKERRRKEMTEPAAPEAEAGTSGVAAAGKELPDIMTENTGPAMRTDEDLSSVLSAGNAARTGPSRRTSESDYRLPPLKILHQAKDESDVEEEEEAVRSRGEILERTLQEFNIEAEVVRVQRGPVVTMYEMVLSPGTKVSKVESLDDDLAIALKAPNVRIVAPIPGKSTIGIEVPNSRREVVTLKELFSEADKDAQHMSIPLFLGKDTAGAPLLADLAMAPHLLIAGATGSGKSISINSIICSIIMTRTPEEVQMLLVDPKSVEFSDYQCLPHLICPVVTDMKKAAGVLQWACKKMDERFSMLSRVGVRNIGQYNRLGKDEIIDRLEPEEDAEIDDVPFYMPHVVIVIDELGELMLVAAKEVESSIIRLSQKARAVGIHLICATQRPSADVITGLIKANLPVKIAFQVSSKTNSRVILDRNGAELLLGRGDMLMIPPGSSRLIRAQGTFVSQAEAVDIVNFVTAQRNPQFKDELQSFNAVEDGDRASEDELYDEAVRIVLETQRGSVSLLQRRLAIGYSRAARLIDIIAEAGLIGPYKGSQAREVHMTLEEWENARAQSR